MSTFLMRQEDADGADRSDNVALQVHVPPRSSEEWEDEGRRQERGPDLEYSSPVL